MSKNGILLSIALDQDGSNPRIVTDSQPLPVSLCDGNGVSVIEQYSGCVQTIEQDHKEIHNGNGYNLSGIIPSIEAGASVYFFISPSVPIHWRYYKISANGGPFDIEIYENPTVTDNGALLEPLNRNRLSSNTSGASIYYGPTVTNDGLFLDIDRGFVTGTGTNAAGELEGVAVEWIIDGGNNYILKLTNNDNGAIVPIYRFFWYEA